MFSSTWDESKSLEKENFENAVRSQEFLRKPLENPAHSKKDANSWERRFFLGGGGGSRSALPHLLWHHFRISFANFSKVTWLLANNMEALSSLLPFLQFSHYAADPWWLVMLLSAQCKKYHSDRGTIMQCLFVSLSFSYPVSYYVTCTVWALYGMCCVNSKDLMVFWKKWIFQFRKCYGFLWQMEKR